MSRTKRGTTARTKHRKVVRSAKGFRGRRKNVFRVAKQAVTKARQYSYHHRRAKKREFRTMWISGINSAARSFGSNYSTLVNHLKLKGIDLNRKVLFHLALADSPTFGTLVTSSQKDSSRLMI